MAQVGEEHGMLTLIIDADDTLWENNIYYEACVEAYARLMADEGYDPGEAEEMMGVVERERIPEVGYAPEEFARSLVISYERLCERRDRPVREEVVEAIWTIGLQVGDYPMVLLEGIETSLEALQEDHRLILLTKGDDQVQREKLARSGLERYFEAVHVVWEKDADVFRDLVAQYDLVPERTWMGGNSPRSDVNPAVEAGIGGVYVPHPNTWQLEIEGLVESDRVTVLKRFADLPELAAEWDNRRAEA